MGQEFCVFKRHLFGEELANQPIGILVSLPFPQWYGLTKKNKISKFLFLPSFYLQ